MDRKVHSPPKPPDSFSREELKKVFDITPNHEPVKLLRSLEKRAKESTAAFVVLLGKDDVLRYNGAGVTAKDLLWALEKMKQLVINDE